MQINLTCTENTHWNKRKLITGKLNNKPRKKHQTNEHKFCLLHNETRSLATLPLSLQQRTSGLPDTYKYTLTFAFVSWGFCLWPSKSFLLKMLSTPLNLALCGSVCPLSWLKDRFGCLGFLCANTEGVFFATITFSSSWCWRFAARRTFNIRKPRTVFVFRRLSWTDRFRTTDGFTVADLRKVI